MTEAEWLVCDEPQKMLEFVQGKVSERKLRLFACACVAQILPLAKLLPDTTQSAFDEVLQYADGHTTKAAMKSVRERMEKARASTPAKRETADDFVCYAIEDASTEKSYFRAVSYTARVLDSWGRGLVVKPQAVLLYEIVANPFRPLPVIDATWLMWNGGVVRRLAEAVYEQQRFGDLPILADASEDAGCDNAGLLEHLRGPGSHSRGCWALDLLLGKG